MTQPRRRFFPARPAQTLPARSVELAVQVRKEPPAPAKAPPGGCDLYGVGWLSPALGHDDAWSSYGDPPEWTWEPGEGGAWEINRVWVKALWEGDPGDSDQESPPQPSAPFRCVDLRVAAFSDVLHVGAIQGKSMANVRWEAAWDTPYPEDPSVSDGLDRYEAWGNIIVVRQNPTGGGGIGGTEKTFTLTATAYCNDTVAGVLVFRSWHPAF